MDTGRTRKRRERILNDISSLRSRAPYCLSSVADPIVLERFAKADNNVVLVSVDVGDRATYVSLLFSLYLLLEMLSD